MTFVHDAIQQTVSGPKSTVAGKASAPAAVVDTTSKWLESIALPEEKLWRILPGRVYQHALEGKK
jgi:hypothetical protein